MGISMVLTVGYGISIPFDQIDKGFEVHEELEEFYEKIESPATNFSIAGDYMSGENMTVLILANGSYKSEETYMLTSAGVLTDQIVPSTDPKVFEEFELIANFLNIECPEPRGIVALTVS